MPDQNEKRNAGWWIGWVGVPTLLGGGGVAAIAKGITSSSAPAVVTGSIAVLSTAFILWRRFGK